MEKDKVMEEVLGDTPDLTVSDLYSVEFKTRFRGFDKERVQGFLARVADSFEALQREVAQLRETNVDLREQIATYRDMEKSLTEALSGAQQMGETLLSQAKREAEVIRSEADAIKVAAEARSAAMPDALREEISQLRSKRARLKADLRAVLNIHTALLNDSREGEHGSVEFMPGDQGHDGPGEAAETSTTTEEEVAT